MSKAMTETPDIVSNRLERKWSRREILARGLWEILSVPFFRCTPRVLWGWRRWVLRLFGATIGTGVRIHPSVRITIPWNLTVGANVGIGDGAILYALGPISVGANSTISQYAHLCAGTHDFRGLDMRLLKPPIEIGEGAWICADAFVGPGVRVGALAVVGARAVVVRDVPNRIIVRGNPAEVVDTRIVGGHSDKAVKARNGE